SRGLSFAGASVACRRVRVVAPDPRRPVGVLGMVAGVVGVLAGACSPSIITNGDVPADAGTTTAADAPIVGDAASGDARLAAAAPGDARLADAAPGDARLADAARVDARLADAGSVGDAGVDAALPPPSTWPLVLYTDLASGPNTGGVDGN